MPYIYGIPVDVLHDPSTNEYTFPNGTGILDSTPPSPDPPNLDDIDEITPQSSEWTIHLAVSAFFVRSGRFSNLHAHSYSSLLDIAVTIPPCCSPVRMQIRSKNTNCNNNDNRKNVILLIKDLLDVIFSFWCADTIRKDYS